MLVSLGKRFILYTWKDNGEVHLATCYTQELEKLINMNKLKINTINIELLTPEKNKHVT